MQNAGQPPQTERSLTVIAFTDLVGYSAMTETNEALALELLDAHRRLVRERLPRFGGVEIKTIGDAFLLEFTSALSAVRCMAEIQDAHAAYNGTAAAGREIHMRVGIHLGDVERRDGDIFGSGVNIAARLEPVAPVDGIAVSEQMHFQIRQAAELSFVSIGRPALKNIGADMEVFVWCRDATRVAAVRAKHAAAAPPARGFAGLLQELRRRKVINTLLLYVGAAWLLQQAVGAAAPMFGLPVWAGTVTSVLLFAGFPVVMYLSWLFDITPQGIRRTGAASGTAAGGTGIAPVLGLAVIVLGSGAMGYQLFIQLARQDVKSAEGVRELKLGQSIAVMPFRDQSPDQAQAFFGEGLSEELTSLLGSQQGLQVAASSSSFTLAAQGLRAADVGKRLGVSAVLDGSILVSGDRLKIRAELVNPADGKVLWTETFSRKLADIFDVEAEVARSIVNLLQDKYLEAGAVTSLARTASTEAYVLYLRGREAYRKQTTEALQESRKLFEEALGLDPEYALAYVGVADSVLLLSEGEARLGKLDRQIAARLMEDNLSRALLRAPQLAEAYAVQGKLHELRGQVDESLSAYDTALGHNPNLAIAHMWRFQALERLGRHAEAMEALEKAYALDPVSVTTMFNRGFELARRGRYDESRAQFQTLIEQFPASPMGYMGFADLAFRTGELATSLQYWRKARELSPDNPNFLNSYLGVLFALGLVEEARPLATDPVYRSNLLLGAGQYDALFAEMDYQVQAARPDEWEIPFEAGIYQAQYGDPGRGMALLLQARTQMLARQGGSPEEQFQMPMCSPAIEFAWALKRSGDPATADKLVEVCERQVQAARGSEIVDKHDTYLAARIAAYRGDRAAAVAELTKAVDGGWRDWFTGRDPLFEGLREDPAMVAQFQRVEAALAAERDKARAILAGQGGAGAPAG